MSHVLVPAERIPVVRAVDVLVCGGGPSGVSAAVAAARLGARVLLVERYGFFGGMATAANVAIWHTLWSMDRETQVIGGLPAEYIDRLQRRGAATNFRPDGRGDWVLETEYAKLVFDEVVREAGVESLLHAWVAGVTMEGGKIDSVVVQTKSGRLAVRAALVVDATGDADVAALAGATCRKGDGNGHMQPTSLCFRIGGLDPAVVPADGRHAATNEAISKALNRTMDYNGEPYTNFFWYAPSCFRRDEIMVSGVRVSGVDCTDAWEFTRAELEGRQQLEWVLRQLRAEVPGFERAYVVDIAAQIGVRETRNIVGEFLLPIDELLGGVRYPDAIAQGTYRLDIHGLTQRGILFRYLDGREREVMPDGTERWGMWTPDGRRRDTPCYQIPYRALLPAGVTNLLVAGRAISVSHEAHGATRVMVNCMQFGQAAGASAALCASSGTAPGALEQAKLRQALESQGCRFLE